MRTRNGSDQSSADLAFFGRGRYVIALDRRSGEKRWDWKGPNAAAYSSLLLDGDRLLVAVNGYIYCLDPLRGNLLWENPLKGMGMGVTSIATARGGATDPATFVQAAAQAGGAAAAGAASA